MQTKKISEIEEMFAQMETNGLADNYREYVELKGKIVTNNLIEAPFSNRKVAYCEAKLNQITETQEQYRDSNGNIRTRINKAEIPISDEKSSQEVYMSDGSTNKPIVLELNSTGCQLDIPKTFDRFENKNNLSHYRYFNTFNWNRFGAETLGFKMTENTIDENQNLYVIGEAYKVGNTLHIGTPQDNKKPFIITTKTEEEMVNNTNKNANFALFGGIIAIIVGIIMFFAK